MPDFLYPTNAELQYIMQEKTPTLLLDDPVFAIMPPVNVDAAVLIWEQMDNFLGLQQVRGIDGQPSRVASVGGKRYVVTPGYYGEFATIDEVELTQRRSFGSFATDITIADLVAMRQDQLLSRRIDRWRFIAWTLLTTGTFTVTNTNGVAIHTDTFSLSTFTAGIAWATVATATPIANLRAIKLLARGRGVDFGGRATLYINQTTANSLLNNTNANDVFGRRVAGFTSINNISAVNGILMGDDLPAIVVYDGGYLDSTGTFQLFIADGKGVLVGARPAGQTIGDLALTRNANNPNMEPGAYSKIVDRGVNEVPRIIEVHDGANVAPRIYYPGSVVRINV